MIDLLFILTIPYMAWTSRMCGGGWPKLPLGLDQWLHCLPYIALLWPLTGWWAVLPYLGAVIGKRFGHGAWMDLGRSHKTYSRERLDIFIEWLRPYLSIEKYDFLGLILSGVFITLFPSLALIFTGHYTAAFVVLISGMFKSFAYYTGWNWPDYKDYPEELDEPTEIGELLTGLFCGIGVCVAWFLI